MSWISFRVAGVIAEGIANRSGAGLPAPLLDVAIFSQNGERRVGASRRRPPQSQPKLPASGIWVCVFGRGYYTARSVPAATAIDIGIDEHFEMRMCVRVSDPLERVGESAPDNRELICLGHWFYAFVIQIAYHILRTRDSAGMCHRDRKAVNRILA
jgi:hypothetical protein